MQQQYVNTAWMLEGAPCWIHRGGTYLKAHIQKLLQQRTIAKILINNSTEEVPVVELIRASNVRVSDLAELSHINQPEVASRIIEPVYLDRCVIVNENAPSLRDYVEYKKHIDERLLKSEVPPHLFSAVFFAFQALDNGKSAQLLVTGRGRKQRVAELVHFIGKQFVAVYQLIQKLIKGVVNYRFILSRKQVVGLNVQVLYSQSVELPANLDYEGLPQYLRDLLKEEEQSIEKIVQVINAQQIASNENIQIIGVLDFEEDESQCTTYLRERVEQIYQQSIYKNLQRDLMQDKLDDLLAHIEFTDNIGLVEQLELEVPAMLIQRMNQLISKDVHPIFIRSLIDIGDIEKYHIVEAIKFHKTSYTMRMTYNEFYQRYHHLDTFNRKMSLQKHLNSNQDMRALDIEICKRLVQSKGMVFGAGQMYMKQEALKALQRLLCQHNMKLSGFAFTIQKAMRVWRFRKTILLSMKRLLKKEQTIVIDKQKEEVKVVFEVEFSDMESYQLLDADQLLKYSELKQNQAREKQRCLLEGLAFESGDVAHSLLEQWQVNKRIENMAAKEQQRRQLEWEALERDASDLECYQMLTLQQRELYMQCKKQNQLQVAFKLLDHVQQHQIKQARKISQMKEFQQKYYQALEPYMSDLEAYKQLNVQQQQEYKVRKLHQEHGIALSLLTEQQHNNRRRIIADNNIKYRLKKQYQVDDDISDVDSFQLLEQVQLDLYKKEKKRKRGVRCQQSRVRYGEEYQFNISDPDSFELLADKTQWVEQKQKLNQYNDISDVEAYLLLDDIQSYITLKQNGQIDVARSLVDKQQYEEAIQRKMMIQKRLDSLNIVRQTLLDSRGFRLLSENEWEQRKQQLQFEVEETKQRIGKGFLLTDLVSVAYDQMAFEQKQQRKKMERQRIKMKEILNPLLFEDELHPNCSVAYRLLDNKQSVYGQYSLAYQLLDDPAIRDQQLREITLHSWEHVNTLSEKQALLQAHIVQYEQDRCKYQKDEFSDYEAFKLLDEDQLAEYQGNAYSMLDHQQQIQHRKAMQDKLIRKGTLSDVESYELLTQERKDKYHQIKDVDVSDYPSYILLSNKDTYKQLKSNKLKYLDQIKQSGYQIYFGQTPLVMSTDEFELFMKRIKQQQQTIKEEELALQNRIQSEGLTMHKIKKAVIFNNIVDKLIQNPDSQPFLIPKYQNTRRILDPSAANEVQFRLDFNNDFLELANKNNFMDYAAAALAWQGKQPDKLLKFQTENLKKPLLQITGIQETIALDMFRSIVKYAHNKRSRYPQKVHLERILFGLLGKQCRIEQPPAPNKLHRMYTIDIDNEQIEDTSILVEEFYLQLVKQIENNKKEHIIHLLKLGVVVSNCLPTPRVLPIMQYLLDKLENCKGFREQIDIAKTTKQLLQNLSNQIPQQVYNNEFKTSMTRRAYLPSDQELTLMLECKQTVIKLYLHSETPIWIEIGHHYDVRNTVRAACKYIGKEEQYFGLSLVERKSKVFGVYPLHDDDSIMDLMNKYEFYEDIYRTHHKADRTFQFHLTIREFYPLLKDDLDSIDLVFYQLLFDVRRGRFQLKQDEQSILQQLEKYAIKEQKCQDFTFTNKYDAKLEYLKILKLADPNALPDIV